MNIENNWLIWKILKIFNINTIVKDKNEYVIKYINHNDSLISIAEIIHLKWLIEENAINFRKDVWLNPPKAPITADKKILHNNRGLIIK